MIILLTALFILSFLVVISALVFFHELGHYSVARLFGVAVERFSIGFGKPIWRRTAKSGTEWVIASIPLGGYVKFLGDASAASNPDAAKLKEMKANIDREYGEGFSKKIFHFKPLWQRALVVLAGPMANFILAALIFSGLAMGFGVPKGDLVVLGFDDPYVARDAGIEIGDKFVSINGTPATTARDVAEIVMLRSGDRLEVVVERDGQLVTKTLVPLRTEIKDSVGGKAEIRRIGTTIGQDIQRIGVLEALVHGPAEVGSVIKSTGVYIGRIFQGKESGDQLGGIVRIATITGKTATDTAQLDRSVGDRARIMALSLISLAAFLSIGLGVANLMPIPVLDGGHLLLYGYEAVAGRPLGDRGQEIAFRFGISVLLGLFVILTWNDIGYVRSIFS